MNIDTDVFGLNWVSYSYSLYHGRKKCPSASLGMKFCLKTVNHSVFCFLTSLFCLFACLKLCIDLRGVISAEVSLLGSPLSKAVRQDSCVTFGLIC